MQRRILLPSFSIGLLSAISIAASFPPAQFQSRPNLPPGGTNRIVQPPPPPGGLMTQSIADGLSPQDLINTLVGPGVVTSNVVYNGAPVAGGRFNGGTGIIGFESGIVLSSGNVASVVGPSNMLDNTTTVNATPGDPDLDLIVAPLVTFDSTVLEFDFECPNTQVVSFQFVLTSEEYNEFVNSNFNDVFAFYLNGTNIALVPGPNVPVSINNVNCNNPFNPPTGANCALYNNNDCTEMGGFPCAGIGTEMDGLTAVFSATGNLNPGVNHIKLAIADTADTALDSNVFIRGQSFVCATPGPVFDPPSPCGQVVMASVGVPVSFQVVALATNGLPGQSVILSVGGDAAALAGGTFNPPLPAGPGQPVSTTFSWTPTNADVGNHQLTFTVIDQLQQTNACTVNILIAECYLFLGRGGGGSTVFTGGSVFGSQIGLVRATYPVTMGAMPSFAVVNLPITYAFSAEIVMHNPNVFPLNPDQWSQRLRVQIDPGQHVTGQLFGTLNGIHINLQTFTTPSGGLRMRFPFSIDGM